MKRRGWPRSHPAPPLTVSRLLRGRESFESRAVCYTFQALIPEASVPLASSLRKRRLGIVAVVVVVGRIVSSRRGVGEASEGWSALTPLASVTAPGSVISSEPTSSDLINVSFFVTEWRSEERWSLVGG